MPERSEKRIDQEKQVARLTMEIGHVIDDACQESGFKIQYSVIHLLREDRNEVAVEAASDHRTSAGRPREEEDEMTKEPVTQFTEDIEARLVVDIAKKVLGHFGFDGLADQPKETRDRLLDTARGILGLFDSATDATSACLTEANAKLKAVTEALRQANDKLADAQNTRNAFLFETAHTGLANQNGDQLTHSSAYMALVGSDYSPVKVEE